MRIVEEREATAEEKAIHEINSGIYCFNSEELFSALRDVRADNSKGEYYLTDVIGSAAPSGLAGSGLSILLILMKFRESIR